MSQPTRNCPACGGEDREPAFSDINRREGLSGSWAYVRCRKCRTLFVETPPDAQWLSHAYQSSEVDPVSAESTTLPAPEVRGLRHRVRHALGSLRGRPHSWPEGSGQGRAILDFGCLGGDKLLEFHQRGWRVAGVDLNVAAIELAKQRIPSGTWHAGPLKDFHSGVSFDVIRADNVLEHILEPLEVLQTLKTHLKRNGELFLYVPAAEAASVRIFRGRSASAWLPYHLQLFSAEGLRCLLSRTGFEGVRLHSFTPMSWWEITARQLLAKPGYVHSEPSRSERWAMRASRWMTPVWETVARMGWGEEWVVRAKPVWNPMSNSSA